MALLRETSYADNGDGWELELRRLTDTSAFDPSLRPLLVVPGYGMNSFIFGFHPRGTSMERCLAEAGIEVWAVDLRRTGDSVPEGSDPTPPSLQAYAEVDVTRAVEAVIEHTTTGAARVDLMGCSLGGSIAYAHLALVGTERIGAVVAAGAPLRWAEAHPALRLAFASPWLAGHLPLAGIQPLARLFLPLLARAPQLLAPYMNAAHVDMGAADQLVRTVADPHPRVNEDIAYWIRDCDMILGGVDVTRALGAIRLPLLVVLANRDGITPAGAALAAVDAWGGDDVEVLRVGTEEDWYAHADLFVGNDAPQVFFEPLAQWLLARA